MKAFFKGLWRWRKCDLRRARLVYPKDHFNYRAGAKREGAIYYAYDLVFELRGEWWIERLKEDDAK